MNDLDRFMRDGPYRRQPGRLVEFRALMTEFLNSLADWRAQIYWSTGRNVEGALKSHCSLGWVQSYGLCVADIAGPGQLSSLIARNLKPHFEL